MFFKITNLTQSNGNIDYKGLNINNVLNPVYDFKNNIAYVEYNETYSSNDDLIEVTQTDYDNAKTALTTQQGLTVEERLAVVEQTLNQFLLGGI